MGYLSILVKRVLLSEPRDSNKGATIELKSRDTEYRAPSTVDSKVQEVTKQGAPVQRPRRANGHYASRR